MLQVKAANSAVVGVAMLSWLSLFHEQNKREVEKFCENYFIRLNYGLNFSGATEVKDLIFLYKYYEVQILIQFWNSVLFKKKYSIWWIQI